MTDDASLGRRGAQGAALSLVGQGSKLLLNLASLVILSRILSPEDYGLVAIVMAIVGIGEFFRDLGLTSAAIQVDNLSRAERSNLWWINMAMGSGAFVLFVALAPFISAFYSSPALLPLTIVLATNVLLSSAATQYRVDLTRRLAFGKLMVVDVASGALGLAAAIVMALTGFNYWALAGQTIIAGVVGLILLLVICRWLPNWYDRTVSIRKFLSMGLPLFGSSIVSYAASNIDTVLLGRFHGSEMVGIYSRGIQLVRLPMNQLRGPLGSVAFSTLSRVQSDSERYARFLVKAQSPLIYFVAAIGVWIALTAPELVWLVLGDQWELVVPVLALFALGDSIATLASAGAWIYMSTGKTRPLLYYTLVSSVFKIALFVAASPFGIVPMAAVYAVSALVLWPISMAVCARFTGVSTRALFIGSLRVFAVFTVVGGASYFLRGLLPQTGELLTLVLVTLIYLGLLAVVMFIIPPLRSDAKNVIESLRLALGRGK